MLILLSSSPGMDRGPAIRAIAASLRERLEGEVAVLGARHGEPTLDEGFREEHGLSFQDLRWGCAQRSARGATAILLEALGSPPPAAAVMEVPGGVDPGMVRDALLEALGRPEAEARCVLLLDCLRPEAALAMLRRPLLPHIRSADLLLVDGMGRAEAEALGPELDGLGFRGALAVMGSDGRNIVDALLPPLRRSP